MPPETQTPRRRLTGAVIPAIAAAAIAALVALFLASRNQPTEVAAAANRDCATHNADALGGPFELVNGAGATVTQADLAGRPAVVYFGFTHCPDVCPTSMYLLGEALAQPGAPDVQSVLISVDPERDTPELMSQYVQTEGFPAGLIGLTGSVEQVDAAKRAFQVYSGKVPIPNAPADVYNVDHSSIFYILDERGQTRAYMRSNGATPQSLAQCMASVVGGS